MIEPLPDTLRALIAGETAAPATNAATQAAVRAKLGATLGLSKAAGSAAAAAGAAGTAVKGAMALKVLAVMLAVGAATTGVVASRRSGNARVASHMPATTRAPIASIVPAIVVTEISAPEAEPAPAEPVAEQPAPAPAAPPHTRHVPVVNAEPALVVPEPPSPRTQSQLLSDASRAFSTGDPAGALDLLDQDARDHTEGPLAEERDALRVSVLIALGRDADASDSARRLFERYPHTIHRALVERALKKDSP